MRILSSSKYYSITQSTVALVCGCRPTDTEPQIQVNLRCGGTMDVEGKLFMDFNCGGLVPSCSRTSYISKGRLGVKTLCWDLLHLWLFFYYFIAYRSILKYFIGSTVLVGWTGKLNALHYILTVGNYGWHSNQPTCWLTLKPKDIYKFGILCLFFSFIIILVCSLVLTTNLDANVHK